MELTPKQRIIFDEDMYDDEFLRDYLAEDYEIYKDELDVSFDEYVEHRRNEGALYDIKERDFTEEMASLRSFLDNGNPLIVSGSIGRWDGTRTGFTVYDNFDAAIDTSPSRFGGDNVFADCEIQKVWDENGHLFIHGAHHDGSVTVELRQLTDAGAVTYEAISEAWNGESFTIIGNNATDWAFKTYDGSEQSFIQAMHDLWDEPSFCQPPHYMEDTGYLSQMDFSTPVKQGALYSILFGDLVAVGSDMDTGDNRDLTPDEIDRVTAYFTDVSKPGSGLREVIAIQNGKERDPERVSLKTEAEQARAASDKLADERGAGSLAREDPTIV